MISLPFASACASQAGQEISRLKGVGKLAKGRMSEERNDALPRCRPVEPQRTTGRESMKIRILTASAAALALAACGGGGAENEANMMAEDNMALEMGNDMGVMNDMAAAPVPTSGQEYATMAAASDLYEIESARLAMEKSENADIDALAEMIVTDHEKSTADLRTAAEQAQPPITVEPEMNAEQQGNMEALRAADAATFDSTYLQQQVMAHEKALAMVRGYAQSGDVPALRQHASTVAGPIERHLERARELLRQPAQ
jgi:putative membrane protein